MSARGDLSGPSILIMECSTSRGSVALVSEGRGVYWGKEFSAGRGQGGELFRALAEAMQIAMTEAGSDACRSLSEILVGLGPGSYSGVRQAVAAAGGLAAASGARLRGFASPLALQTDAKHYHAVGDARRGTFYHTAVAATTRKEGRASVAGPALLDDLDALNAKLALHPDWPLVAIESLPPGLPATTPVAWPSAMHLPLSEDLALQAPPLEPIYLRPVSITLPRI